MAYNTGVEIWLLSADAAGAGGGLAGALPFPEPLISADLRLALQERANPLVAGLHPLPAVTHADLVDDRAEHALALPEDAIRQQFPYSMPHFFLLKSFTSASVRAGPPLNFTPFGRP